MHPKLGHAGARSHSNHQFRRVAPPKSSYNPAVAAIKGESLGSIDSLEQLGESLVKNNDLDVSLFFTDHGQEAHRNKLGNSSPGEILDLETDVTDDDVCSNMRVMNYDLVSCKRLEQIFSKKRAESLVVTPDLTLSPTLLNMESLSGI